MQHPEGGYGAFGTSVALEGEIAVVGAWLDTGVRYGTGCVHVFNRVGDTWLWRAKLVAGDGDLGDEFGYTVAISGNTVIVGAPGDDNNRGAVYVFTWNGSSWGQQRKLVPVETQQGDEFGYPALAIDGDTAIAGVRGKAVYFFNRSGADWSIQSVFRSNSVAGFAQSVAIKGNVAVFNSGHVVERIGNVWVSRPPFSSAKTSVAFDGTRIVAGDSYADGLVGGSGVAYVFRKSGNSWSEEARLVASDGAYIDSLGDSVALDGDHAIAGAPYEDSLGAAYVFKLQPASPPSGLRFVPMPPCRLMETRSGYNFEGRTGSFGPPFLNAGETRTLNLLQSNVCPVPTRAKVVVLNTTLVPRGGVDFVTIWPNGEPRPDFWTVRSPDGNIVANSAMVKATNGVIQVYASNATDLLLDISGYFTDDVQASTQGFFPLTPCRVIDTRIQYRSPAGPFGPPSMTASEGRRFRFPSSPDCSIPAGATAYSVTITAVPSGPLQFLTAWPAGAAQPNVSNINSPVGRVLANSVILPASVDGSIDVFAYNQTDFLVDINGYFASDNGTGLFYFPVTQCRISDSRNGNGSFGGPIMQGGVVRTVPISASSCTGIAPTAKAYALNVTALQNGSAMPFITAWPTGQPQPNASILNAFQGQTVSNSAIIPAGTSGAIDVVPLTTTHVVLEVSSYFGR